MRLTGTKQENDLIKEEAYHFITFWFPTPYYTLLSKFLKEENKKLGTLLTDLLFDYVDSHLDDDAIEELDWFYIQHYPPYDKDKRKFWLDLLKEKTPGK